MLEEEEEDRSMDLNRRTNENHGLAGRSLGMIINFIQLQQFDLNIHDTNYNL